MATEGGDRSFGAPRFDIVLRGYDRRQVDEHLSRLQRVLSRMRGDLEAARSRAAAPMPHPGPALPGLRPRPTPRRRRDGPPGAEGSDVVGTFTERMQIILQSAEDEATEIVAKARSEADRVASSQVNVRAAEEEVRATLTDLVRRRDAVLADLTRVRGQLEALLAAPTARIPVPQPEVASATSAAVARRDAGAGHPLPGTPASPPAGIAQVAPVDGPPARTTPEPAGQAPAAPTNGSAHHDGPSTDGPSTAAASADGPSTAAASADGPSTAAASTAAASTAAASTDAGSEGPADAAADRGVADRPAPGRPAPDRSAPNSAAAAPDGPAGSEDTVKVGAGGSTSSS